MGGNREYGNYVPSQYLLLITYYLQRPRPDAPVVPLGPTAAVDFAICGTLFMLPYANGQLEIVCLEHLTWLGFPL